ncbi:hypothetical protein GCM10010911_41700 [Paenibacillus nasutitermitis]|uniref:Major Facilitator Superfamily protein n=1 Tax=Paenibacillus nasutitermitis TaxID=1652958 RepID=A0A917DXE6_9BACL|nr:hypothetical protein GCM10010911_41700 [Paenibacillus nasutitermitis]
MRLGATMSIVGFSAGGLISAFFSYKYLLVFDGVMYIGSTIVLLKVHWVEHTKSIQPVKKKQTVRNALQSGRYTFLLMVGFVYPLAASAYQYALPLIASVKEHGDLYNGFMWSTIACGSFICSLIIKKHVVNEWRYLVSILLFATFVSLTFIYDLTPVTFLILILVGATEALVQVCHYTLLQRSDENIRGRLFGLNTLVTRCGFLAGFGFIPLLAKMTSLWDLVDAGLAGDLLCCLYVAKLLF